MNSPAPVFWTHLSLTRIGHQMSRILTFCGCGRFSRSRHRCSSHRDTRVSSACLLHVPLAYELWHCRLGVTCIGLDILECIWHHDGHVPLEIKSEKSRAKAKKAITQYNKQHRKEAVMTYMYMSDKVCCGLLISVGGV